MRAVIESGDRGEGWELAVRGGVGIGMKGEALEGGTAALTGRWTLIGEKGRRRWRAAAFFFTLPESKSPIHQSTRKREAETETLLFTLGSDYPPSRTSREGA